MRIHDGFQQVDGGTADEPVVIHRRPPAGSSCLAIFLHGLNGNRYGTWTPASADPATVGFAKFLYDDVEQLDVGLYSYRTGWRRLWFTRSIPLETEAKVLADLMRDLSSYSRLLLIAHSMGGLLARAATKELIERNDTATLRRLGGLFLLATPLAGSLRVPPFLWWLSPDGRALRAHGPLVTAIVKVFTDRVVPDEASQHAGQFVLPTWIVSGAEDWWVDWLSSGLNVPSTHRKTIRGSHTTIVKPRDRNDDAYAWVRERVEGVVGSLARIPAEALLDRSQAEEQMRMALRVRQLWQVKYLLDRIPSDHTSAALIEGAILVGRQDIWERHRASRDSTVRAAFARGLMLRGDLAEAWTCFMELLDHCVDTTERIGLLRNQANTLSDAGQHDSALSVALAALRIADALPTPATSRLKILCDIIRVAGRLGRQDTVDEYGIAALRIAYETADQWREQIAHLEVSLAYSRMAWRTPGWLTATRRVSAVNVQLSNPMGAVNEDLCSAHDLLTAGDARSAAETALRVFVRVRDHGFMFAAGLELVRLVERGCSLASAERASVLLYAQRRADEARGLTALAEPPLAALARFM